jgi:hypothetical protein
VTYSHDVAMGPLLVVLTGFRMFVQLDHPFPDVAGQVEDTLGRATAGSPSKGPCISAPRPAARLRESRTATGASSTKKPPNSSLGAATLRGAGSWGMLGSLRVESRAIVRSITPIGRIAHEPPR